MKKIISLIILFIALLNFENYAKKNIQTKNNAIIFNKTYFEPNSNNTSVEVFYWNEATLNGMSLATNKTNLIKKLGNFDSVKVDYDNCNGVFQNDYSIVFIKNSRFQLCEDSIITESISFDNDNKLIYNNNCFSKKTTLLEFSKSFPEAYKSKRIVNNDDFGLGDNLTLIKLKESDNDIDYAIHFFFKGSKLFLVARWYPC